MECGLQQVLSVRVCKYMSDYNNFYIYSSIIAVDCGPFTNLDNGQVNTSLGTTFGSVAMFICNTGYILSHQQIVMCGADGMWAPASPFCAGKCT